ncbi:MAG: glycosyltransferase family 39 protein [Anaerolineae bacterium]|nr:glycosyltransferase family 39 protein [Anaerolineae bacterium]
MQSAATNTARRAIVTAALLVLALGIGIWAQRYLTDRSVPLDGIIGYIVAAALFVWALNRNPAQVLRDGPRALIVPRIASILSATWRQRLLIASGVLFVLAFLFFGRDTCAVPGIAPESPNKSYCFTPVNTALWLAALAAFYVAVWDWGATNLAGVWRRIRAWRVPFGWTAVALLGILAVAAFFRFYQLASVPAEPTSDHAEKLYDVIDILNGTRPVFLARNTGRELFQFYWTAGLISLFNLPTDHLALKLGTALISFLTIPFVFLLGREVGGRNVGLLAAFLTAISKWHVEISRVGLRFPFTAAFATPTLFFLLRGMRLNRRNDWLLAGLFLGIGLHTYTSMRIVPVLVAALVGLRLVWDLVAWPGGFATGLRALAASLWRGESQAGAEAADAADTPLPPSLTRPFWTNVAVMVGTVALFFLPLLRFSLERPDQFWYRSLTRSATTEAGNFNPIGRLVQNVANAALQFNYRGDVVWVNNVMWDYHLDPITAALFALGFIYILLAIWGTVSLGRLNLGVLRQRSFAAVALLVSLILLLLPSILALAFPIENPSVVRGGGAPPIAMIIAALPIVLIARNLRSALGAWGKALSAILVAALLLSATVLNFRQYFQVYDFQERSMVWNASEMATVLKGFTESVGDVNHTFIVAWPNWVDTRNVYLAMGAGTRNNYILSENLPQAVGSQIDDPAAKIFLVNPSDQGGLRTLQATFPTGQLSTYQSRTPGRDFLVYFVPARGETPR